MNFTKVFKIVFFKQKSSGRLLLISILSNVVPAKCLLRDTHKGKPPSNKTPALTKSMNMDIWIAGTLNQLFIKGS